MAVIEILGISPSPMDSERLSGFTLDTPAPGSQSEVYAIPIAGWVVARRIRAVGLEVVHDGRMLRKTPVSRPRPDVRAQFPDIAGAENCGFRTLVGVLGMAPEFELLLQVVLEDQNRIPLTVIRGRHPFLASGFQPSLQPLMITSLGRTGTTWLMRLLAEHPEIVVYKRYPYELRTARYWMHMLKVLSEPGNLVQSSHPDSFHSNPWFIGHNPFYSGYISADQELGYWFGHVYVEQLAAFCQRSIEECYQQVAHGQGQARPSYFAEKHLPDHIPWLIWGLYERAREIFLVRDFRDMLSSVLAFNAKRGYASFGRELVNSDTDFVRYLRNDALRLQQSWEKRSASAYLLRYEDLILRPVETLSGVLEHLELNAGRSTVLGMLERASAESWELEQHQTSSTPRSSIGRWRRELDASLQTLCQDAFADLLKGFGYPESA